VFCCKAVQFPVLLFCEVLPNLTTFQINVYSLFLSVFYSIYNFCTGVSSENIDKILFEPHTVLFKMTVGVLTTCHTQYT
jgi:hypothetical protein